MCSHFTRFVAQVMTLHTHTDQSWRAVALKVETSTVIECCGTCARFCLCSRKCFVTIKIPCTCTCGLRPGARYTGFRRGEASHSGCANGAAGDPKQQVEQTQAMKGHLTHLPHKKCWGLAKNQPDLIGAAVLISQKTSQAALPSGPCGVCGSLSAASDFEPPTWLICTSNRAT